jgi:hypothetical protein
VTPTGPTRERGEGTNGTTGPRLHRRTLLGAAVTAMLAGCSGDGGDRDGGDGGDGADSDGDDGGTPTATGSPTATDTPSETPTETPPASSKRLNSEVSELAFVSAEQDVAGESDPSPSGTWLLRVTVENTGDQETNLFEYDYEGTVYDADGNEIGGIDGKSSTGDSNAAPGGTGEVTLSSRDVDPEEVARYEVALVCTSISEGVYCDNP